MPQRVMISGVNGFIGSALMRHYEAAGAVVIGLSRADFDYEVASVCEAVEGHRPDVFIHAAGNASVAEAEVDPDGARASSVGLTSRILQGFEQCAAPPRFVFLSTAAVYGNPEVLPISEEAVIAPVSVYGAHKGECEALVQDYQRRRGADDLIVRIFSLFGAEQKRLVLYELFRQFQDEACDVVTLRGSGAETRDFLSIDVFCERLMALVDVTGGVEDGGADLIYNVASGEARSILDCAHLMKDMMGSTKSIQCLHEDMGGNPNHWQADMARYDRIVKGRSAFDFRAALSEVLGRW